MINSSTPFSSNSKVPHEFLSFWLDFSSPTWRKEKEKKGKKEEREEEEGEKEKKRKGKGKEKRKGEKIGKRYFE